VNIQEYISSGIIESYVLGLASVEESAEFEKLCAQYPELVKAREEFEIALEKQSVENAIAPPADTKEKIWNKIKESSASNPSKIITMQNSNRPTGRANWVAAAAVILFLVSGFFAYKFYNDNKTLKTQLNDTKNAQAQTDARLKILEEQTDMMKKTSDENVTQVNLVGTTKEKPSTKVYWDSTSSDVYLVVQNMPRLPSDKQYQLWALLGGKPMDLGLFDAPKDARIILKMKNVQKADAFAITIENKGNSGGPNLEQLQSMGKPKL
jgi:anti-sigma-K factor RskA